MTFPYTDFCAPAYLTALAHGTCAACLDATPAFLLSREARSGGHLPNLSVCRDCRWEAVAACRRLRETVTAFVIGDAALSIGDALVSPAAVRQPGLFDGDGLGAGEEASCPN